MNLFIWGCQFLWFLYILHREICLMNDKYMLFHCLKEWKAEKHCLDSFFVFKISNRIQKCRSRQLYSCENQFNVVIISIQPPGRMKRSVVLSYKSLPSLCMSDTLATLQAGREGWRKCEHHMGCVMAHWVSRACGTPVLADPVLTHCLCPPAQPLPLLWCLEASGMALDELRLQALSPQGTEKNSHLSSVTRRGHALGGSAVSFQQPQLQMSLQK